MDSVPPTERPNPSSLGIDIKSSREIVGIIHEEDHRAWQAVGESLDTISRVVDAVVGAFRCGGRLIYLGAGTSGRLGVLDAAECPPTFGVEPHLVQGILAGGDQALRSAVEGAEDSRDDGMARIAAARVRERDVVCGIAASGNTPFVWGGLEEALRREATTVLLTSNPHPSEEWPVRFIDYLAVLPVGPEVIAGSTRMKAGTATKMALNMITTAAMIRWGKVYDNLMVDLMPSNRKLRERALDLIERLAGVDAARAAELLETARGRVKIAVLLARGAATEDTAEEILERHEGRLRGALEEIDEGPS